MYRIVIAEDEEDMRELLSKNINQSQSDFVVVGKAENGQEAVKLVQELKPDILITDICMPFVSGLDLIRQIQALDQPIKTVIISGYDDFSYAKQALTLGVTDYLLKPFMPDELYEVLRKIGEELDRQKTLMHNLKDMQDQLEDNLQILKERFWKNLIQGTFREDQVEIEAQKAKVSLSASCCSVGILRIQQNLAGQGQDIKDFLSMVQETYFDRHCQTYLVRLNERQLIMVFMGDYRNNRTFLKVIKDGITGIGKSMEKYYDLSMHCVLGGIYGSWEKLSESYRDGLSVWRGILDMPETIICYDEEVKSRKDTGREAFARPGELEQEMLINIQMGRTEKALDNLYEILQYYEAMDVNLSEFVSISLVELVFHISSTLMKAGGGVYVWEDENVVEYLKEHFAYGSLRDAKEVLEEYVTKCCEKFANVNKKQGDRIVFQVKELIEKNLGNEEFNLETASAQLFFSHNYVRQIFKQITGESFMEYVIRRRMELAKVLLRNPECKIQEVAVKTGYSNQRYFASCFKKYYGCTPTEYRGECLKDE